MGPHTGHGALTVKEVGLVRLCRVRLMAIIDLDLCILIVEFKGLVDIDMLTIYNMLAMFTTLVQRTFIHLFFLTTRV